MLSMFLGNFAIFYLGLLFSPSSMVVVVMVGFSVLWVYGFSIFQVFLPFDDFFPSGYLFAEIFSPLIYFKRTQKWLLKHFYDCCFKIPVINSKIWFTLVLVLIDCLFSSNLYFFPWNDVRDCILCWIFWMLC